MIEGTLVAFLNEHVLSVGKDEYKDGEKAGIFYQTFLLTKDHQHPNSHEHMHIYVAHSLSGLQNT